MRNIIKVNNILDAKDNPIRPIVALDANRSLFAEGQTVVIHHTQTVSCDNINYYVEIQFEEGMTWNDFINSPYNDESKMTGEETCIGKFSIDSEGYVISPVDGFGPMEYDIAHKGTDKIIPDIIYEVPRTKRIYYGYNN